MIVPAPAVPVRIRAPTAEYQGTSPEWLAATRTPARAATRSSAELSSRAPSSIPRPCTTKEEFMSTCSGEQMLRPS
ncbi:hypothetical protein ACFVTE_15670 [Arthrobacter sp. NPDC058097]|uniref:hypothetical protein n=1 Tax=Arthrobacter sp. NPDC058097 TaxID=3346340 RepID=UPI0036DCBDB4